MEQPTMFDTLYPVADTASIVSYFPLPGLGVLPINSFVIRSSEPVLVDTGIAALRDEYMSRLREVVDPRDLKWIWLTHTDWDHIGNLEAVLAEAPDATVVTTFLGMGKLGLVGISPERTYFLNPGQKLDVGDRELLAVKPPTFDAPETTGLFDTRTRTLFSADSFGAVMDEPAEEEEAIERKRLKEGLTLWATVDSPWLHMVDESLFRKSTHEIERLEAKTVLSSHLPPTKDAGTLLRWVEGSRNAPVFVGPDQAAVEAMFAEAATA